MRPAITVIVAPHERHEAVEAYKDRLTLEEIERILNAPEDQFVRINLAQSLKRQG